MAKEIRYQINVQIADNPVAAEHCEQKIFTTIPSGTADMERIAAEIMKVNPGLQGETVRMVLRLESRIVLKLLSSGMRVNHDLFEAVVKSRGPAKGDVWDEKRNSLYIQYTQSKLVRQHIGQAKVHVEGLKGEPAYLTTGMDASGKHGFTATAGKYFTLRGKYIKVKGTHPDVGITLTTTDGVTVLRLTPDNLALNFPSKIMFLVPQEMKEGEYTLNLTTQYSTRGELKVPRVLSQPLYVKRGTK